MYPGGFFTCPELWRLCVLQMMSYDCVYADKFVDRHTLRAGCGRLLFFIIELIPEIFIFVDSPAEIVEHVVHIKCDE